MSLQSLIARAARPVRVGLIGSGKFGTMFLNSAQASSAGVKVVAIADMNESRSRQAVSAVGWPSSLVSSTKFLTSGSDLISLPEVDVVVEATGNPAAGISHARQCIKNGKHVVMVNVEADVLAGPLLAREARDAGVVYSLAYGDQPALVAELIDWARSIGFQVVAAGKGTKYLPEYHWVTPDDVWAHYGLSPEDAKKGGMNPQMFNSFLDGTKSAIEMAAIANSALLNVPKDGLLFPPAGADDLPSILRPKADGGVLERSDGIVETVSSLNRDGTQVDRDLRWGVYVTFKAPNEYARACFREYGLKTDSSGWYASMYKPYHLIGLELGISVLNAALRKEATGQPMGWKGDVVAVAKRDLRPGEQLDGEGGYTVFGKLVPAERSLSLGGLPIGLAHKVKVSRAVKKGQIVGWADVSGIEALGEAVKVRKDMERMFGGPAAAGGDRCWDSVA